MKRYCEHCRTYSDAAALFCPTCGQYTNTVEIDRIAPEGDVIYSLQHYNLSYKDNFLYVVGKKFVDFEGRASRGECFQFILIYLLIILGIITTFYALTAIFQTGPYLVMLGWIFTVLIGGVLLIPLVSTMARRMHDTGRPTQWLLTFFVPFIGPLILLLLLCKKGTNESNSYGEPLRNISIDERLAAIMKVSPTSTSARTAILVSMLVCLTAVFSVSSHMMGDDTDVPVGKWMTNSIVGEGSVEKADATIQGYFDSLNQKDYDKALTYIAAPQRNNPKEREKWIASMKSIDSAILGSAAVSGMRREGNVKQIRYALDLQITESDKGAVSTEHITRYMSLIEENGEWKIEGFTKEEPKDK